MGYNGADFAGEKNPNYKHGLTDGGSYRHPIYTAWQNMRARCYNPKHEKYHRYGGRGITVCDEWMTSTGFSRWAALNGWAEGLTIDRIDNDGNYEPNNCRWTTKTKNSQKKSTTKLTFKQAKEIQARCLSGETQASLAEEFNICVSNVWIITHGLTWKDNYE